MPILSLIRRELKNARIYFIRAGETVDSIVIAAETAWPEDVAPNYEDYQFEDIETVKEAKEIESENFKIPKASGGYTNDTEEMLVKRMWTATTSKTNNLIKQLEHALATPPAVSTGQAPFVNNVNFIDGVLLLKIQNKNGVVIERTHVWARLRLVSAGDVGPSTSKVEFSIEQRESSLNLYTVYAG